MTNILDDLSAVLSRQTFSTAKKKPQPTEQKTPQPSLTMVSPGSLKHIDTSVIYDHITLGVMWKYLFRGLRGPCLSMEKNIQEIVM